MGALGLELSPLILRVTPPAGGSALQSVQLSPGTTILALEVECPCIRAVEPLPRSSDLPLGISISSALPGVKTYTVRTTTGSVRGTILVDVQGATDARTLLEHLGKLQHPKDAPGWVVIDGLADGRRNCGCSPGSLGGVEYLAALPQAFAQAGLRMHFALTGPVEDPLAQTLAAKGWRRSPTELPSGGEVQLSDPTAVAIIANGPTPENLRIIHPVPGGLLAEVLFLDPQGKLREVRRLPIDRTLPAVAQARRGRPVQLSHEQPSQACATCHSTAHQTWQVSAHARAWASLTTPDRTNECAPCHVTGGLAPSAPPPAADVHCQACHQGATAHAVAAVGGQTRVKTSGLTECRSCHDAAHHPGFDPIAAWLRIQHGK